MKNPKLAPLENLKSYLPFDLNSKVTFEISDFYPEIDNLTPYNLSDCVSSLLLMQGLLIGKIWEEKTGVSQHIKIDRDRAMEMLYRPNFIQINNQPLSLDAFKRYTSLTHKTKDGNFVENTTALLHIHEGVLNYLNTPPAKESVQAAFLSKTADELEKELNELGLGGQKLRTKDEFRAHPQGKALLEQPPYKVERLNDRAPKKFEKTDRPLSGLKVLDLTQIIAGPMISNILAEQGADVLHIANPSAERIMSNVLDTGQGKRSAYLNFNNPKDLDKFFELVKDADVFVSGYAPGRLEEKFGITEDKLLSINPDLIMVINSAFGPKGPFSKNHGWENIAQASAGCAFDNGTKETPLLTPYGFITDYGTGIMGSIGVLAAVIQRATEGGAQKVTVSLARTAMWYQDQGIGEKGKIEDVITKIKSVTGGGHTSKFSIVTKTGFGDITHLAPVLEYSHTKAYWDKPVNPLGSDYPEWW